MKSISDPFATPVDTITLSLPRDELIRLDEWIALRPHPQPTRAEAVRYIFELGLLHGNEVEYLRDQVSKADRDIRDQFDRVFGALDNLSRAGTIEEVSVEKMPPILRVIKNKYS